MIFFKDTLIIASTTAFQEIQQQLNGDKAYSIFSAQFSSSSNSALLKNLKYLIFTSPLRLTTQQLEFVINAVSNSLIESITLSGMTIDRDFLITLPLLKHALHLKQLSIEDCKLPDTSTKEMQALVQSCTESNIALILPTQPPPLANNRVVSVSNDAAKLFRTALMTCEAATNKITFEKDLFFKICETALTQLTSAVQQGHPQALLWRDRVRIVLGELAYYDARLEQALAYFNPSHYCDPKLRKDAELKLEAIQSSNQKPLKIK